MKTIKRKYRIVSRKRITISFVLIALLIMLGVNSIVSLASTSDKYEPSFEEITVVYGDTLWGIAKKYASNVDVRKAIYIISELNDVSPDSLSPGQKIFIPEEI